MQFDMEDGSNNNGGSEQARSSDDGQFMVAFRKMMEKEVEVVVIRTVEKVIVPIIGDLVRTVVKEEIQSVEKRLLARNANEVERLLELKLSQEVSDPVLTGKPLRGKGSDSLKVELVDRETGQVVKNGPISSAKVEILVLDASNDDSEHDWTLENFNSKIIREGDKKRPHFTKNVFIYLEEGVGILSDVKLGHNTNWMKSCKCRLGARIVSSFRGFNVQEGRTGSFTVADRRGRQYEKHYPPSLSDKVWRLDYIGRDGNPCKRLKKENIKTVEDFLFLLSVDPDRLRKLVRSGAKWKATVDHARTCPKDDKVYLHYYSSTESKMGVIFDVVGGLKGIINDSHYVPINDLSADEKDNARKLLLSAFKNREARTPFDDEASLLKQFPYRPSDINSPTKSSIQEGLNGDDLSVDDYPPVEPSVSSQSNGAYIRTLDCPNNFDHSGNLASTDMGQMCSTIMNVPMQFPSCLFRDLSILSQSTIMNVPTQFPSCPFPDPSIVSQSTIMNVPTQFPSCPFPDPSILSQSTIIAFDSPSNMLDLGSPESLAMGQLHGSSTDTWTLMDLINSGSNNHLPLAWFSQLARAMLWVIRVKKRVMTLGGIHAHKKQKT